VIHLETETKLYFRNKPVKSRPNQNVRNQDNYFIGKKSMRLASFCTTVIEFCFRENWTVEQALQQITIFSINLIRFDSIAPFGEEIFTQYIKVRDEYPKSDTMNKNLKFNANSSYGITAEGISDEKYSGKYYLPSIASSITGYAEFCVSLAETRAKLLGVDILTGDTDSAFMMGLLKVIKQVNIIFEKIDPLVIENEKGMIKSMLILGRKNYSHYGISFTNPDKEVFVQKTHGAGSYGYRIYGCYEAINLDILKNKKTTTQAIKDNLHLFPLGYQIGVKKSHTVVKWLLKGDNRKFIKQFDFEDITIYAYQQDKTLLLTTNNQDLITGQFFNYLNVNIYESVKLTYKQKEYNQAKKKVTLYRILMDAMEFGFDWQIFDPSTNEAKEFIKLWNNTFDRKITTKTRSDEIDDFLDGIFDVDYFSQIRHYESTVSIYEEEKALKDEIKSAKIRSIIIANFSAIPMQTIIDELLKTDLLDPDVKEYYRDNIDNRKFGLKHLESRYILKDTKSTIYNKYRRYPDPESEFKLIIKPEPIKTNDPDLPITVDYEEYDSDGIVLQAYTKLPELEFSSKLLADQNKYYSQAIINAFSLNASINYAKTHKKDYSKFFDMPKENLPCPKQNTKVKIYLKMRLIPKIDYENNLVSKSDIDNSPTTIQVKGKYQSLRSFLFKQEVIRLQSKNYYKILDLVKLEKIIEMRIRKNEFTTLDFNNQVWSVEIVNTQTDSINYNATLSINVVVGKNRMFFANLHINPASDKMINFKSFKIIKDKIKEESHIIKKLVIEFMEKTEYLHKFNHKTNVTIEGLESSPINWLDYSNLILRNCATNLKEFHLTTDITCENPELVVLALEYYSEKFHQEVYLAQTEGKELELRQSLNFSKATRNAGLALINRPQNVSMIAYSKSYNQLADKVKRVGGKNKLGVKELKYLRNNISTKNNQIRIETQMKSPIAISEFFNYVKHNTFVEIVIEIVNQVNKTVSEYPNESDQLFQTIKLMKNPNPKLKDAYASFQSLIVEETKLLRKYAIPIKTLKDPPN